MFIARLTDIESKNDKLQSKRLSICEYNSHSHTLSNCPLNHAHTQPKKLQPIRHTHQQPHHGRQANPPRGRLPRRQRRAQAPAHARLQRPHAALARRHELGPAVRDARANRHAAPPPAQLPKGLQAQAAVPPPDHCLPGGCAADELLQGPSVGAGEAEGGAGAGRQGSSALRLGQGVETAWCAADG